MSASWLGIRDRAGPGLRPGFFPYPESRPIFITFLGFSWTTDPGSGPCQ